MDVLIYSFFSIILFVLLIFCGSLFAAPWVPTRKEDYDEIARLAELKPGMTFYDLGSGSASMLFYFSKKYNVSCVGIEISPILYLYSKIKSLFYRKVEIKYGDFYWHNLSEADVIYVFLLPKAYDKLNKKINKKLKTGARLISAYWPINNYTPIKIIKGKGGTPYYLYQK
jgi:SAM-dependent methyltransferase